MSKKSNVLEFDQMMVGKLERAGNRGSGFSPTNAPPKEENPDDADAEFLWADVDIVEDSPQQPRGEIQADSDAQRDLVTQINEDGQEQAARAREHPTRPGYFQLIAGHRRKYSIKDGALFYDRPGAAPRRVKANAGINQPNPDSFIGKILLRVDRRPVEKTEPGMRRRGYQENRSHKGLAFIEDALYFQRTQNELTAEARAKGLLGDDQKVSVRAVAKELGERDHTRVQRGLAALTLPPQMVKALGEGKINERNARGLLILDDHPKAQRALFREVLTDNISGAATERMAEERLKALKGTTPALPGVSPPAGDSPAASPATTPPLSIVANSGAAETKTRSQIANLPNLPGLVLDQLQGAATSLESAGHGIASLDFAPQDVPVYEAKIAELESLVKRARRQFNKQKSKPKAVV